MVRGWKEAEKLQKHGVRYACILHTRISTELTFPPKDNLFRIIQGMRENKNREDRKNIRCINSQDLSKESFSNDELRRLVRYKDSIQ